MISRIIIVTAVRHEPLGALLPVLGEGEGVIRIGHADGVPIPRRKGGLKDQIPVSQNSGITVTTEELSGGHLDKEKGTITWLLHLNPNEQKELLVQYRVKYPKNRRLVVE